VAFIDDSHLMLNCAALKHI